VESALHAGHAPVARPWQALALAGHMSRAMLERYSHIRMQAKREAVEAISLNVPTSTSVGVPTMRENVNTSRLVRY